MVEVERGEGFGQNGQPMQRLRGVERMAYLKTSCCSVRAQRRSRGARVALKRLEREAGSWILKNFVSLVEKICFITRAVGNHWMFLSKAGIYTDLHLEGHSGYNKRGKTRNSYPAIIHLTEDDFLD